VSGCNGKVLSAESERGIHDQLQFFGQIYVVAVNVDIQLTLNFSVHPFYSNLFVAVTQYVAYLLICTEN